MISAPFPTDTEAPARNLLVGLAKIGLALRNEAWRRRGPTGLTPTQAEILTLLRMHGDAGLRLGELAGGLGVTGATASESVRALETKGLVRKARDPRDGRALAVVPTPAGVDVAEQETAWPDLFLCCSPGSVGAVCRVGRPR